VYSKIGILSFCAAALILQVLKGYEEFKKDYPDFKYPLEYR